jgi:hypothetical protein
MIITLEVLSDLKHVLKEDAGISLNFDITQKSKTKGYFGGTLPPCACSLPIPPLITSFLCSLQRVLWLIDVDHPFIEAATLDLFP